MRSALGPSLSELRPLKSPQELDSSNRFPVYPDLAKRLAEDTGQPDPRLAHALAVVYDRPEYDPYLIKPHRGGAATADDGHVPMTA